MKHRKRPPTPAGSFATPWLLLALLVASPPETSAIITFRSPADPAYNTSAPTGNLADSGWQLQGRWGVYLGTPIAPNLFITARHVTVPVGEPFYFRGRNYTTIDSFADPDSDLRIWKVCGIFPEFATLYEAEDEIGKPLVVFGRGTQRGVEVEAAEGLGTGVKGWMWGEADYVPRWGENVVSEIVDAGGTFGELLSASFDASGGDNEAHLSSGDSGGGLFVNDAGVWKLAGINYSVDGPFNTSTNGGGFNAANFDQGGLYTKPVGNNQWVLSPDLPVNIPSAFYATRISANLEWIGSIITRHSVTSYPPILQSTTRLDTSFSDATGYAVDETAQSITLDEPPETLFLRLRGCKNWRIESMQLENGQWILRYGVP